MVVKKKEALTVTDLDSLMRLYLDIAHFYFFKKVAYEKKSFALKDIFTYTNRYNSGFFDVLYLFLGHYSFV